MAKKKPDPDPVESRPLIKVGETLDEHRRCRLACNAMLKNLDGVVPAKGEIQALKAWERQQSEKHGQAFVHAVPKSLYLQWVKINQVAVTNHANKFDLPLRGRHVDVPAVLESMHQLLAKNASRLTKSGIDLLDGNGELDGVGLERWRKAKADIAEDERDRARGDLIRRIDVRDVHTRWSAILRDCGMRLKKMYGQDAVDVLNEALDDCERVVSVFEGEEDEAA